MEEWFEIYKGLIPFDDYLVKCIVDNDNNAIIDYIGKCHFRITIKDILGFRIIDESSELRDPYAEAGLAENRPTFLTNYIYEVKQVEFGDIIHSAIDKNLSTHHYKLMSMNYLIDIVSENVIHIEQL